MMEHIQQMVQRFKLLVREDDRKARSAMCFALAGSMERAIARAAFDEDLEAMAEARALAHGLFDLGASTDFTPEHFNDYLHVAKLLDTPGEVKDEALAFEGLYDFLSLRVPIVPRSELN